MKAFFETRPRFARVLQAFHMAFHVQAFPSQAFHSQGMGSRFFVQAFHMECADMPAHGIPCASE